LTTFKSQSLPAGRKGRAGFLLGCSALLKSQNRPNWQNAAASGSNQENVRLHVGVEADFHPARKAHPAFIVDDLDEWIEKVQLEGYTTDTSQPPLDGYKRAHIYDPFGNRIELMERL
jgi:catechol 2,3-dioxygenase-like lactoylglutathione lyase family enzyme